MLHRQNLLYHSRRSDDLLKIKPLQDADKTVIERHLRKVKLSGMVSESVVKDKSSHIFRIISGLCETCGGITQSGSVITYKFTGTSKKLLPRFESFLRMPQKN